MRKTGSERLKLHTGTVLWEHNLVQPLQLAYTVQNLVNFKVLHKGREKASHSYVCECTLSYYDVH